MRHIRNFFHNINDVVLAIVIVALAAGIIYWRMQVIMDYPKELANERAAEAQAQEEQAEETAPAEESAPAEETAGAAEDSEAQSEESADNAEEAAADQQAEGEESQQ